MNEILNIRENIISFYKTNETITFWIIKFLIGVLTFTLINNLGFAIAKPSYAISIFIVLFLSLIFSFAPISVSYVAITFFLIFNLLALQHVALLLFLFLCAVWLLYVRILPKESILILGTILAFKLNIEYVVPVLAGLYFALTSIIAIIIGVFIWKFINTMVIGAEPTSAGIIDIVENVAETYSEIFTNVYPQTEWVVISSIFVVQVILINLIKNLEVSYAREIAVISAMILNIVSFIIAITFFDFNINILPMIFWTIVSYLIVVVVCFMDVMLDYQDARKVKFEDEKNYYYVKIIPKIYVDK